MAHRVGPKGQVVIEKEIRDKLGIEPGWLAIQQLVEDHVEISFIPREHDRSLAGILAPYTNVRIPDQAALREARERAWDARARKDVIHERGLGWMSEGTYGSDGLAFLDTSMIIRYLVQDVPDRIEQVRRVIEKHPHLWLTEGIIAETAYVLTKVYQLPRDVVVDALIALFRRRNIQTHGLEKMMAIQGLLLFRPSGRVSFADAMLWALARSTGIRSSVFTLDERFPASGIGVHHKWD